jgi:hypothetical protein
LSRWEKEKWGGGVSEWRMDRYGCLWILTLLDYSSKASPVKILICGTKNFAKKTKVLLEDMGYLEESIHTFE